MSKDPHHLPDGVRLPQKYRHAPVFQAWFVEGVEDGAAGLAFRHHAEAAFVARHGQAALTAYAEGYNEGRAAWNSSR